MWRRKWLKWFRIINAFLDLWFARMCSCFIVHAPCILNGIDKHCFMLYKPVSLCDGVLVYLHMIRSIHYPVLIFGLKYGYCSLGVKSICIVCLLISCIYSSRLCCSIVLITHRCDVVGSDSVQTSNVCPNVFLAHGHPDDPNFMNCAYTSLFIIQCWFCGSTIRFKSTFYFVTNHLTNMHMSTVRYFHQTTPGASYDLSRR